MTISKGIVLTFIVIFLISIDMIEKTNATRMVPVDKEKLNAGATLVNLVGGCNPISRCRGISIKEEIIKDIKKRKVKDSKKRKVKQKTPSEHNY